MPSGRRRPIAGSGATCWLAEVRCNALQWRMRRRWRRRWRTRRWRNAKHGAAAGEVSAGRPPVFTLIHQSPNALSSFYLSLKPPFFPLHWGSSDLSFSKPFAFFKLVTSSAPSGMMSAIHHHQTELQNVTDMSDGYIRLKNWQVRVKNLGGPKISKNKPLFGRFVQQV